MLKRKNHVVYLVHMFAFARLLMQVKSLFKFKVLLV